MDSDAITHHIDTVRELSKPGRALGVGAPTATTANPAWWSGNQPTPARARLHRRLIDEVRAAAPNVESQGRALVLAGPPGAGKGDVKERVLGQDRDKFLDVDADTFKSLLMREAQADGSYESWLMPEDVRRISEQGEQFFPLELASLVHEESSYLARVMRTEAIAAGDNITVDTVLGSESTALHLGQQLSDAGYRVQVADVEVPYELSQKRIRGRWESTYREALSGEDALGGRWVPSEYARDVFDGPNGRSKPEANARQLAEQCPAVTRYRVYRTGMDQADLPRATPTVEIDLKRSRPGEPLRAAVNPRDASFGGRSSVTPGPTSNTPRRGPQFGRSASNDRGL